MEIEEPKAYEDVLEEALKEKDFEFTKDVIVQCRKVIQNNLITVEDLMLHIETKLYNEKSKSNFITLNLISEISKELLEKADQNKKWFTHVPKAKSSFITPEKQKYQGVFSSASKSASDLKFVKRDEQGEKFISYNPSLPNPEPKPKNFRSMSYEVIQRVTEFDHFLNSTINAKAEALLKRFERMRELYRAILKDKDENFDSFEILEGPIHTDRYIVARILLDAGEGKINEESIILDSPGQVKKVSLCLDKELKQYTIFPSQILTLFGNTNEFGDKFFAKRIVDETVHMKPEERTTKSIKINQLRYDKIIVAAGPYTTNDSIIYFPLNELVTEVKVRRPDALILLGPFIHSPHEVFDSGVISSLNKYKTFEGFFAEILLSLDFEFQELAELKIFVIPSAEDLFHLFPLPQVPFKIDPKDGKLSDKFVFLSNPSTIRISNDATIKFFNSSLISDLLKESLVKTEGGDRVDALLRQIYNQRTLVPMHPISSSIDLRKLDQFELDEASDGEYRPPDIVILPSVMVQFARKIQNTIFLNPGLLCKVDMGTYAEIIIYSDEDDSKVDERIKINLIKI